MQQKEIMGVPKDGKHAILLPVAVVQSFCFDVLSTCKRRVTEGRRERLRTRLMNRDRRKLHLCFAL